MNIVAALVCALATFFVGFALRIAITRSPMRQRLRFPPLHCRNCAVALDRDQRNPIFALMRGRSSCTNCGLRVWRSGVHLEILLSVVAGIVGLRFGFAWALPAFVVFFVTLALITIIDLRDLVIPNRIIYPGLVAGLVLLGVAAIIEHDLSRFGLALVGMAAAWLFFFLVWFIYPAGMGFGDVRLSALIGLFTGWLGLGAVVAAIMLGLIFASIVGVMLIVMKRRGRKDAVPFGPFLAAGAAVTVLAGSFLFG